MSEIDVSSIKLNDIVSVDPSAPIDIGDYDSDGISDLMVKFDRAEVQNLFDEPGDHVIKVKKSQA